MILVDKIIARYHYHAKLVMCREWINQHLIEFIDQRAEAYDTELNAEIENLSRFLEYLNMEINPILKLFRSYYLDPLCDLSLNKYKIPTILVTDDVLAIHIICSSELYKSEDEMRKIAIHKTSLAVQLALEAVRATNQLPQWEYDQEQTILIKQFVSICNARYPKTRFNMKDGSVYAFIAVIVDFLKTGGLLKQKGISELKRYLKSKCCYRDIEVSCERFIQCMNEGFKDEDPILLANDPLEDPIIVMLAVAFIDTGGLEEWSANL